MNTEIASAWVRTLNDAARCHLSDGLIVVTPGIRGLHPKDQAAILDRVKRFDDFTPENDPWGEHDFGSFRHNGRIIFWKIDCYDLLLKYGSPDPSDPVASRRVITVMLADEY